MAITPRGRRKDELAEDDIRIVPIGGGEDGRAPAATDASSDLAIHRAVHSARPDVGAVAHAHLPAAMGLTLGGELPDPAALPEAMLFIPRLPFVPYGEPGSEDLARRIAAALTDRPEPYADVVLLERHGAVAVGLDLPTAIDRLELVEVLCRSWRDALVIRAARHLLGADRRPNGTGPTE